MPADIPMTSLTGTAITEEPDATLRRGSSPLVTSDGDVERQNVRRTRPTGIRRSSSGLSTAAAQPDVRTRRRDTLLSHESSFAAGQPTRSPTIVVEDEALHGYPKLASFLGGKDGYAIYRRFAFLNARNLLYNQAKLVRLEHELHEIELDFANHEDLHYRVDHIFNSQEHEPGHKLRMKYEQVSTALDKYNKLLLDQERLHALPSPDNTFIDSIYNFIKNEKAGNPNWLEHPEDKIYAVWEEDRKPIQKDLVALNPDFKTRDPFTTFFQTTLINWWHKFFSRFAKAGDLDEYEYEEKTISRAISAITMILASSLPTCSIVALYFIHSAIWRLVFIVLFSGVFASSLAFFTNAKRPEIFLASVSLASVQVVFVGTAFGGNDSGNSGM